MTAEDIIETLGLRPHPEGGWFTETWRAGGDGRATGTAIYFLLTHEKASHWHTVDAAEIWHYYAGAPLNLLMSATEVGPATTTILGPDLLRDQRPQAIVPPHWWQAAETTGDWTLVGCTVSPGFEFDGFHLAEAGFDIPRG